MEEHANELLKYNRSTEDMRQKSQRTADVKKEHGIRGKEVFRRGADKRTKEELLEIDFGVEEHTEESTSVYQRRDKFSEFAAETLTCLK